MQKSKCFLLGFIISIVIGTLFVGCGSVERQTSGTEKIFQIAPEIYNSFDFEHINCTVLMMYLCDTSGDERAYLQSEKKSVYDGDDFENPYYILSYRAGFFNGRLDQYAPLITEYLKTDSFFSKFNNTHSNLLGLYYPYGWNLKDY